MEKYSYAAKFDVFWGEDFGVHTHQNLFQRVVRRPSLETVAFFLELIKRNEVYF